jgi:hypothetical protein
VKVRLHMRYRTPDSESISTFKGIRETDIRDYYLPSPLALAGNTPASLQRTLAVPLPTRRLMRRGS